MAAARAQSRRLQLDTLVQRSPRFARQSRAEQIGTLLSFERLCDAIVEGEFERLEADPASAIALLQGIVGALWNEPLLGDEASWTAPVGDIEGIS